LLLRESVYARESLRRCGVCGGHETGARCGMRRRPGRLEETRRCGRTEGNMMMDKTMMRMGRRRRIERDE